ncbi:MAG: glycoside hydrolase family 25, partial [Ruminococcus sp.]|nr:glycoside hydrolase family 25 [Ruminococcus sp.]
MKFTKATAFILSFLLLTGCSKPVAKPASAPVSTTTSPTTTNASQTSVTVATETVTTQPATTTMAVSEPPAEALIEGKDSIEVYSETSINDFIVNTNVELLNGDELIDTSQTGVVEFPLTYIYNGTTYNQSFECLVQDTIAPTLLNSGGSAMIETGEAFELTNVVGVADNYDRNVRLTYEGTVNSSVAGKYPIHAYATDASGNCT